MNRVKINNKIENIPPETMLFFDVHTLPILPFFLFSKKFFEGRIITLNSIELFSADIYATNPIVISKSNKIIKLYRNKDMNRIYMVYYELIEGL